MWKGRLVSIHIAQIRGSKTESLNVTWVDPQKGLRGDRYYASDTGSGKAVTLIEIEAICSLLDKHGIHLEPADSRRNLVTEGVPLNSLLGQEFRVGEIILRGIRLCDPCRHLEDMTQPGVLSGLIHRGGLRADVVRGGIIRVGDRIEPFSA